jgi:hypothetical protein
MTTTVSKATAATFQDYKVAEEWSADLDDHTINFVTINESHSLAPMLASLPGGHCTCPHWGYLFKGRMTVTYADHVDTIEAGDAFFMAPGHVPAADAGTEFVMFSPADQLKATNEAVAAGMQANSARS